MIPYRLREREILNGGERGRSSPAELFALINEFLMDIWFLKILTYFAKTWILG